MPVLPVFSDDKGQTLEFPLACGLKSRRLALGCMQMAGSWEPGAPILAASRERARSALETALELGWNCFDHADIYCRGRSETVFGELVSEMKVPREAMIIQSKCGVRFQDEPNRGDPHRYDFSRKHLIDSTEGSLRRLGMEYLDILLLHRPDLLAEPEEVLSAFAELRDSGKVRYFGVSNFTPYWLDLFEKAGFTPVANQVEISLLRTSLVDSAVVAENRLPTPGHPADGTLEWHRREGVVTQAWAPMAYGYLSGRNPDWDSERVGRTSACVSKVAHGHGVPPEAIVIAWLLRHPAMIQPIIGSQDPARLRACDKALTVRLTHSEWYELYTASRDQALP